MIFVEETDKEFDRVTHGGGKLLKAVAGMMCDCMKSD